MAISTNGTIIARLAGGLYNQTLSSASYNEVVSSVKSAADINALANSLVATDFAGKTDAQIASVLLSNLGLSSVAGLNNWVAAQITAAGATGKGAKIVSLLNDFSNLTSDATYGASASSFNTKVDAALALSQSADFKGGDLNAAATLAAAADAAAAKVAADAAAAKAAADAAAAKAAADAAAAAAAKTAADAAAAKAAADAAAAKVAADALAAEMAPRINTLTTTADVTLGAGSGNDSFYAVIGTDGLTSAGTTLNAGDNLNGKAGTGDTLFVTIAGTNTVGGGITTSGFTLSGVEKIDVANYQSDDAKDNTLNLALATGVTTLSVSGSAASGDTLFTTVRNVVTAEMANGAGDLSIAYVDSAIAGTALLGTGETQVLNLNGQTGGTFTATNTAAGDIETLTINSTGSANTVAVTVTGATTINVTGDKNLTLTEGMTDTITRVNASAFTGNLDFTTNDATAISVTGGSGNDAIKLGGTFTSADSIDGGAGVGDSLTVSTSITTAATLANVTNVETLVLTGGANLTLAAPVGPTTFTVSDATASIVTLNAGYTGATTVNLGVTDRVVNSANVALTANVTAANAISGAGISITGGSGVDTLNITATGAAAFTLGNVTLLDRINAVDGGDTIATAGADISITVGAAYATNLTVDASALDAGLTSGAASDTTNENLTFDGSLQSTATTVLSVVGGNGLDTITGGAGNDILIGGGGNDSINGSAGGADSISGGDGADTINMGGALTSADTIDGGNGNDTLTVSSLTSTALANVTNIETLSLSGAGSTASLTSNLSFTTIDLDTVDNTAQVLTIGTGYTSALTALVDSGDKVTNTANVALTVTADAASLVAASATTLTGGTGADTLSVLADNTTANIVATQNLITGFDTIIVRDGGDVQTGTITAGKDITIDLTSYATATTALVIDASALDAGTGTNSLTNAEVLTITGTSARALNVTGGGASDTIVGSSNATIGDSLVGGDGNDTFTMAGNLSYLDTIDGGAGAADVISVSAATADVQFMRVTNVEQLTLGATSNVLSTYFDATGIATVNLWTTQGTVDATGTQQGHSFIATAAVNESVAGGFGVDTLTFNGTGTLDANDSFAGGAGTDRLILSNAAASVTGTVDLDNVTSVETITLGTASGNAATTAENIGLTVDTLTLTTAQTITLDGSIVTDSNDKITVTNNASTTTTKFNILGGAGADTLAGSSADDTITGNGGNDVITGGAGVDNLTGGAGNDVFAFAAATDTLGSGKDTVTDFTTAADRLRITLATGDTNFDATYKGVVTNAGDSMSLLSSVRGQYLINSSNNTMSIDLDGNGLLQSTDFALTLTGVTALTSADIDFSITGGTSANTITTGSGNDSITSGGGSDVINSGAGDDAISISASAQIDAGAGTDTLTLTADSTATTSGTGTFLVEAVVLTNDGTDLTVDRLLTTSLTSVTGNTTAGAVEYLKVTSAAAGVTNVSGITFTNAAASITGAAGADSITGGSAADIIASGGGADLIIGGGAADSITGGGGVDTIRFTATTPALLATEAGTNAGASSTPGTGVGESISSWTSGTDKLQFASTLTSNAAGTLADTLLAINKTGTVTNAARYVHIANTAAGDNVDTFAGAVTILNALTTTAVAIGDSFIAAMDNDTNVYLYLVKQVSTADTIAAQDVTYIGVINGITSLTNGDFVSI